MFGWGSFLGVVATTLMIFSVKGDFERLEKQNGLAD